MPNQLIIEDAAIPGDPNSYYSEEKTLSATGSPAYTLIPEVGWILWESGQDSDLTLALKITASPTYAVLVASAAGGLVWSDGVNLFVHNVSTTANCKYFVLAHKP